jgi:inorganic pyrophosphatase
MRDRDEMDEKVLCVPAHDPLYTGYLSLADVPKHFLLEVEHFFSVYKDLEGHRVQSLGWEDRDAALSTISDALTRYALKQRREEIIRLAQTEVPREGLEL